jgi:DUF4097 and DUF4098 domain-containing protein YvlB
VLLNGGITVTGYNGKSVMVEARLRRGITKLPAIRYDRKNRRMRVIPGVSTNLKVTEKDNIIKISVPSWMGVYDLSIKVPWKTSLKLKTVNEGGIKVKDVIGDIEANNLNGSIKLMGISGTVVAHTLNGNIFALFKEVNPSKPMSFSTLNGDLDVSLPHGVAADVKLNSTNGEIFSDFDIKINKSNLDLRKKRGSRGLKYQILKNGTIFGSINGGGKKFSFNTFNGDIFLRKK